MNYISPMPFVYSEWKNFNDLYSFQKVSLFRQSGKNEIILCIIDLALFPQSAKYYIIPYFCIKYK